MISTAKARLCAIKAGETQDGASLSRNRMVYEGPIGLFGVQDSLKISRKRHLGWTIGRRRHDAGSRERETIGVLCCRVHDDIHKHRFAMHLKNPNTTQLTTLEGAFLLDPIGERNTG